METAYPTTPKIDRGGPTSVSMASAAAPTVVPAAPVISATKPRIGCVVGKVAWTG